jgi:C4-dicarboxylate transporter, DctM subunit
MVFWTLFGGLTASVLSGAVLGAALGSPASRSCGSTPRARSDRRAGGVEHAEHVHAHRGAAVHPARRRAGRERASRRGVYRALAPVFARISGGLLHTNIAVCTIFGAVSGSSMSVAAAVGSVAYPELKRRGYDKAAVVGSLAGGGTLGLLIPPSLSLLIYGALTDTSIGKLFVAGVVPGLMMAALFSLYIFFAARRNPAMAPERGAPQRSARPARHAADLAAGRLIVAVLGSLFAGIATPTEAAAVGVAAAIVLGFTMGELTLAKLGGALMSTTRTFAVVGMVFLGALILAQAISLLGLPQQMLQMGRRPRAVEVHGAADRGRDLPRARLLLRRPLDDDHDAAAGLPAAHRLGFDPIWLGVVITLMIEIGMLTPPVGMNLFVLVGITNNDVPLGAAANAAIPYWLALLLGVLLMTLLPASRPGCHP